MIYLFRYSIALFLSICHLKASSFLPFEERREDTVSILTIDGGGTRGIIPATFLAVLQDYLDEDLIRYFDITGGTSTGALIALGLNVPQTLDDPLSRPKYKPHEIVTEYENSAPYIFSSRIRNFASWGGILRPRYARDNLADFAQTLYQNTSFSHALTNMVIPTYSLSEGRPLVLRSHLAKYSIEHDYRMAHIALATTAAPTYFAPYQIENYAGTKSYTIDGGVVRNNPDISAVSEACRLFPNMKKMIVLSLGTGRTSMKENLSSYSANYGRWVAPLMQIFLNGPVQANEDDMQDLMRFHSQQYYRLQIDLPHDLMALDNGKDDHLEVLKDLAIEYTMDNYLLFEEIAETLRYIKEDK